MRKFKNLYKLFCDWTSGPDIFLCDHLLHCKLNLDKQDTVVLWSKSSTLDWKVKGSNPAAANFSFEVDDLDARRKKEDGNKNRRARERPLTCERARNRTRS